MSYASWVVRRSIRGLEAVEMVAEKDTLRCQKKIERLEERIVLDREYINFARETRVVMSQYVLEIEDAEEDLKDRTAKAGSRLLRLLPNTPRVKGIFRKRLVVEDEFATA